jgi:hypothetical protein
VPVRVLDDDTYRTAFDAWHHALGSIVSTCNEAADPANLMPAIPAAMQRAVELIREHKPAAMTIEEADRLVEALEAPYPERVVRSIRAAMGAPDTDFEKVDLIAQTVAELGLEPSLWVPKTRPGTLTCFFATAAGSSNWHSGTARFTRIAAVHRSVPRFGNV